MSLYTGAKKVLHKLSGRTVVPIMLVFALGSVSGYFVGASGKKVEVANSVRKATEAVQQIQSQPSTNVVAEPEKANEPKIEEAKQEVQQPPAAKKDKPTLSFVSTANWKSYDSPDGSFSVKFGESTSTGVCDKANVIMAWMFYMAENGTYKCSSAENAMYSSEPVYAYIVFASVDTVPALPRNQESFSYKMADGATDMTRYEYENEHAGTTDKNILYVAQKNNKKYIAWQRFPGGQNTLPDAHFETYVHKTWQVK